MTMALEDATNPMQGVSGPGKFAKRTDLQYQPDQYGAGIDMTQQMQGAPLAKAMATPSATNTDVRQAAQQAINAQPQQAPVSLYAPSARPQEPITSGINIGPGPGSEALMMNPQQVDGQYQNAYQLFNQLAANPNASPTLKYLAQRIQQGF